MSNQKYEYKFIRLDPKAIFLIDDDYKPKKFWTLNTEPEFGRSYEKHLNRFQNGIPMECPTIIKKDNKMHLVSGNTRLMFSRALGVRPEVVIGEFESK